MKEAEASMAVGVVIVNYRTAGLVVDCLRSIAGEPGVHAIVVDNASGDGSVDALAGAIAREGWQGWASLLPLDRNGGFASGSNAGMNAALRFPDQVDYLMLLNPDTVLRPGAIRALVDFMHAHPRAGVAGSRLENAAGSAEYAAHSAPSPIGELVSGARLGVLSRMLRRYAVTQPAQGAAHECEWVSGASFIVRREVLEQVGFLDEGFFLYFEEMDFCRRAREAGWQVWWVPQSRVMHLEGASTGIRDASQRRPRYWYESRRRYFVKHFGRLGLLAADVLWLMGRASLALRRMLRLGSGGSEREPKGFAVDLLWGDLRSLLGGKRTP
jgi:GT2 family glycosyltransferase